MSRPLVQNGANQRRTHHQQAHLGELLAATAARGCKPSGELLFVTGFVIRSQDKVVAHVFGNPAKIRAAARRLLGGMHLFDKGARVDKVLARTAVVSDLLERPVPVDGVFGLNRRHDEWHRPYFGRRGFRSRPLQLLVEAAGDGDDSFRVLTLRVYGFVRSVDSRRVNFYGVEEGAGGEVYG